MTNPDSYGHDSNATYGSDPPNYTPPQIFSEQITYQLDPPGYKQSPKPFNARTIGG